MLLPIYFNEEDFPSYTLASPFTPQSGLVTDWLTVAESATPLLTLNSPGRDELSNFNKTCIPATIVDGIYKLPVLLIGYADGMGFIAQNLISSGVHFEHVYPAGSTMQHRIQADALNATHVALAGGRGFGEPTRNTLSSSLAWRDLTLVLSNGTTTYVNTSDDAVELALDIYLVKPVLEKGGAATINHTVVNDGEYILTINARLLNELGNPIPNSTTVIEIPGFSAAFLQIKYCHEPEAVYIYGGGRGFERGVITYQLALD